MNDLESTDAPFVFVLCLAMGLIGMAIGNYVTEAKFMKKCLATQTALYAEAVKYCEEQAK